MPMLWPILVYFALVLAIAVGILTVSYFLGERHWAPATGRPYEAGIESQGSARVRITARFYLVAMFFVIFDLEAAFIFAWAVAAQKLGWPGYAGMAVFVGVLLAALGYLWRIGALEWAPETVQRHARRRG